MFIKILTPNHNGKIELTVTDLEALIQEAVDKAIREKCTGCNRYYGGFTYLTNNNNQLNKSEITYDQPKLLCNSSDGKIGIYVNTNTNDWENKE